MQVAPPGGISVNREEQEKGWIEFEAWCRERGLRALPAHPWTLAAWARSLEPRHRLPKILERIRSVARVHLMRCRTSPDRDPIVIRTLDRIEHDAAERKPGRTAPSLFPPKGFADERPTPPVPKRPKRLPPKGKPRTLRNEPPLVSRRPPPA